MPEPQHRTAHWRRGRAALRLFAAALGVAAVMSVVLATAGVGLPVVHAQAAVADAAGTPQASADVVRRRAAAFLQARSLQVRASAIQAPTSASAAQALIQARAQHLALAQGQAVSLNTPWIAVGPLQVQTSAYGLVTGRITSVAFDLTDTSGNTVCTITSQYSDLSATGTVSVTVLTGTTTAKRIPLAALLPLVLMPVWMLRRRGLSSSLAALGLVCVCCVMSGCGTGRTIAQSGSGTSSGGGTTGPVTPSGSYTIVASATAAGVTHSVSLTLVVK